MCLLVHCCLCQAPSISNKSHGDDLEEGDMDPGKMMYEWGLSDQYANQNDQVEGQLMCLVLFLYYDIRLVVM